jgi:hypothetical protein
VTDASKAAGSASVASADAPTSNQASNKTKGRRLRGLVLALAGAAVALAYGRLVLGMRLSPPLVMLGLGGLTLVLAALALWRVLEPLTDAEDRRGSSEHRAPHRIRELEREKQVVLKAIKEIELDFQMKKIAEADYREMVERYRARALRLMGELAVGEDYRALIEHELKGRMAVIRASAGAAAVATAASPSSAPAAPAVPPSGAAMDSPSLVTADSGQAGGCRSCGTLNDPDARFCKSCGTSLLPPASSSAPAAASAPK